MFAGDEAPGAAEPGLDLVDDEERAVALAQPHRLAEVGLVRQGDALALDRLDDEGGDLTTLQRRLQGRQRSEEHTSELQSLMRKSYAVLCLKKNNTIQ